ncbi:MAG: hypothetical protein OXB92_17470 [Acidimicrobiaceae bacterium]|nr:hypothetical protein [Acidimicrobiaceae bacterium]
MKLTSSPPDGAASPKVTVTDASEPSTADTDDTIDTVLAGAADTVTVTDETGSPLYSVSLLVAACVTLDVPASTPDTVNVCAVSQLAAMNVRAAGVTVAFAVIPDVGVTTTFAVGSESNTTVYIAVASSTTCTVDTLTVTPCVSSSVIVTVTSVTDKPDTDVDKIIVSLSSSRSSLVIDTVPVAIV